MFRITLALCAVLFTIGCDDEALTSTAHQVELTAESNISGSGTAYVVLFGYDEYLMDASASEIVSIELEVESLPAVLSVDVPNNPHESIDQGQGPVSDSNAKFYFSAWVDLNGDGEDNTGDLTDDMPGFVSNVPELTQIELHVRD